MLLYPIQCKNEQSIDVGTRWYLPINQRDLREQGMCNLPPYHIDVALEQSPFRYNRSFGHFSEHIFVYVVPS